MTKLRVISAALGLFAALVSSAAHAATPAVFAKPVVESKGILKMASISARSRPAKKPAKPAHVPMVGNDRDAHGCIGSAGYVWSESKKLCVRPWEETAEPNPKPAPKPTN